MSAAEFDPDARAEFLAAVEYYEERQEGLGRRFRLTVESAIDRIGEMPFRFRMLRSPFRRCLVPAFPYSIIFSIFIHAPVCTVFQAIAELEQPTTTRSNTTINRLIHGLGLTVLCSWTVLAAEPPAGPSPFAGQSCNPALQRFGRAVIFYVSFDGHALAEITGGNPAPQGNAEWANVQKQPGLYAPGVYGQGMKSTVQQLEYLSSKADLGASGTLSLWLKPEKLNHKGSYCWPAMLHTADGRYSLMFGRMGDPRNHEILYAHLAGVSVVNDDGMADWKPGQWHLFVVTWDRASLSFSVDGCAPLRANLKTPLKPEASGFRVTLLNPGEDSFIYDEFMVLDIPLNASEIRWLYEQVIPPKPPHASAVDK